MVQKQLPPGLTYEKVYRQNIWLLAWVLKQRRCNPDFNQEILSIPFTVQREYWSDGQLNFLKSYKNDLLHGLSRQWYENGKLYWEEEWQHGQLHGLSRKLDENGQLCWERVWQNGKYISEQYY